MNDTALFMNEIYGGKPDDSWIAVSSKARGFAADFYQQPAQAAVACAGGVDVYTRVTPLRELPPLNKKGTRGRGDADQSAALLAVCADLDIKGMPNGRGGFKEDGFDSLEHAVEVGSSVIAPTVVIDSAGGAHLYVVLTVPLIITGKAEYERACALEQRYLQAIGQAAGFKVDSVHDLARVLRPPGTFNGKGDTPRPVSIISNGNTGTVEIATLEAELPPLNASSATKRQKGKRAKRDVTVDKALVTRLLADHPGLEALSARSGADPSADDYALVCAAAREDLAAAVIEQLLAHRLLRHGDPKGKATRRDDYIPRTVERALAEVGRQRRNEQLGDPLQDASTIIVMKETPIVTAEERRSGRVVLERADGRVLRAGSLGSLARYDRLAAELAAQFGHELTVEKGKGASTAQRFVAALRRHFGPAYVRTLEDVVEGWMIDLVKRAGETAFKDTDSKLVAWKHLDELEPADATTGASAFAKKVDLAHDKTTGDRYLQAGWAQEYLRRCGWRNGLDEAVDMLVALGLEQLNRDGRVSVRRRADGELVQLRFWMIPKGLYERWTA